MIRASEHTPNHVDCLILGAGITGAGVARDAALRGLSTLVVDSHDFASGTSHLSSKLVHGGFRYLEHLHLKMVWEGVTERERLLHHVAPNLLRPLKFVLPFRRKNWLKWTLAAGIAHCYGLPQSIRSSRHSALFFGRRLKRQYPYFRESSLGIAFWDAQTNDARLVLAALRSAENSGAVLCNYTRVVHAFFEGDAWSVDLGRDGQLRTHTVRAKTLVNATGPWSSITASLLNTERAETIWVKGSHILLRRPESFGDDAIIIRSVRDGRPLWVVPWENRLMVGSTESTYTGDLRCVRPTSDEVSDLFLSVVEALPGLALSDDDIRCAFAGVRPIAEQPACSENSMSRRHCIRVDPAQRLITVSGGKLTTFRRMGEQAVDQIERLLGRPGPSREMRARLRNAPLWPGITASVAEALVARLRQQAWVYNLGSDVVEHLVRLYGLDAIQIVEDIGRQPEWGRPLAEGLPYCLAELAYLCRAERVHHLLDLVKRRTPIYFLVDDGGFGILPAIVERLAPLLGWNAARCSAELAAVAKELNQDLAALGRPAIVAPAILSRAACA